MYCAYCKDKFEAYDEVISFNHNDEVVHAEECFEDYAKEKFVKKTQNYVDLLEERVL
jgi:hypothetical protein